MEVGLVFGTLYFGAATHEWRNVVGLLFLVGATLAFLASVPMNILFSLEWPLVAREYLSGANAIGPYVTSKCFFFIAYIPGDVIMASLVYFMAGASPPHARTLMIMTPHG
jgi:hypothetical protein